MNWLEMSTIGLQIYLFVILSC